MEKSKKKKKKFIHLRPFDKWKIDWDYYESLSDKDKEYFIQFTKETINGQIINDKSSVLNNSLAQKNKLKELTDTPEKLVIFKKRKKEKEIKDGKKYTDLSFVKKEWQREFNREVAPRRNDLYSTFYHKVVNTSDLKRYYPKLSDLELQKINAKFEEDMETHEENKGINEDLKLVSECLKADRLDFFVYSRLLEIVDSEKEYNINFNQVLNDLKDKNKEFEDKKFKKTRYMLFLYSLVVICKHICIIKENKVMIGKLDQLFNTIIFPSKKGNKKGLSI